MSGCTCATCVAMCRNRPGIPAPHEALELMRTYPHRMMTVVFSSPTTGALLRVKSPAIRGKEGKTVTGSAGGTCTFLRKGRCELHAAGVKPQECRETDHDSVPMVARERVLERWAGFPVKLTGR